MVYLHKQLSWNYVIAMNWKSLGANWCIGCEKQFRQFRQLWQLGQLGQFRQRNKLRHKGQLRETQVNRLLHHVKDGVHVIMLLTKVDKVHADKHLVLA